MQVTPFQADCARKAEGLRDYQDRRMRSSVCAECLVLRKFHYDTGCKFRRMRDREWADYCGVDFAEVQEDFLREVAEAKPGVLGGQFWFTLSCGHREHRLLDRMHPQMPLTLRCASCAKGRPMISQTAVAGSKTLEEADMDKVVFSPNIPVEAALKFNDGRLVEGRFGGQMQYSLTDGRVMYLDLDVGEKLNQLQLRRNEAFVICKRTTGKKGAVPQWEVYRPDQEARPAPRPPVDATGIDESDIEAEARARKVAELRAVIAKLEEAGAGGCTPALAANNKPATPAGIAVGNGNKPGTNGSNGNGHRPYEAAGIPPHAQVKIPMNIAFTEIIAWMKAGLEANHLQWSDAAQQDLLSTALIGGMREGWISIWERGGK